MRWRIVKPAIALAALVALTSVLAACGTTGQAAQLLDTSWELDELNGQDAIRDVLVSMTFGKDDKLTGTGGCNRYSGSWEHSESRKLDLTAGASTRMACEDTIMTQEQAFFQALEATTRYRLDEDELNLYNADGVEIAEFDRMRPTELTRTQWQVVAFNDGQQAVIPVLEDSTLLAVFDADDGISGQGGCNTFTGGYSRVGANGLEIGELAQTLMACDQPIMDQETQFLQALRQAHTFELGKGTLDLRAEDGSLLVTFHEAN